METNCPPVSIGMPTQNGAGLTSSYTTCTVGVRPAGTSRVIVVTLLWAWLLGWLIYQARKDPTVRMVCYVVHQGGIAQFSMVTMAGISTLLIYQNNITFSHSMTKVCTCLEDISYPLYLVYYNGLTIMGIIWVHGIRPGFLIFIALLSAMLAYHAVDRPLRLRQNQQWHKNENWSREFDKPAGILPSLTVEQDLS